MISRVKGRILEKGPSHLVLDVSGIGLLVRTPLSAYHRFGGEGEMAEVVTHLHVRDDALDLYGFPSHKERRLFRMLLGVTGIGPRSALGILSGMSIEGLEAAIMSGDVTSLTRISGVGRKTAQRIVVELKGPLSEGREPLAVGAGEGAEDKISGAVEALVALGLKRSEAYRSVTHIVRQTEGEVSLEDLVKRVLGGTVSPAACEEIEEARSEARR